MKFDMADINRRFRIKEEEIRRLAEELEKRDREIAGLKAEIERLLSSRGENESRG